MNEYNAKYTIFVRFARLAEFVKFHVNEREASGGVFCFDKLEEKEEGG